MIDAHCHITSIALLRYSVQHHISILINCQSPQEWQRISDWQAQLRPLQRSFGVHPWDSARFTTSDLESFMPYYRQCDAVGEIGLDQCWTDTPLHVQIPILERQLAIAVKLHKPVIVHTKACERQILDIIKQYHLIYCVHWYDCAAYQSDYIELGCYMSLGPDWTQHEALRQLAQRTPLDRLLIESDGLESIAWAFPERSIDDPIADYARTMRASLEALAQLRGLAPDAMAAQLQRNYQRFLTPQR